jgi:hypothetical protein
MTRLALPDLPFWPRFLSVVEAARYVGVSDDVFVEEVKAGVWPAATRRGARGGRLTWDRVLLDRAADRASGLEGVVTGRLVAVGDGGDTKAAKKAAAMAAIANYGAVTGRRGR